MVGVYKAMSWLLDLDLKPTAVCYLPKFHAPSHYNLLGPCPIFWEDVNVKAENHACWTNQSNEPSNLTLNGGEDVVKNKVELDSRNSLALTYGMLGRRGWIDELFFTFLFSWVKKNCDEIFYPLFSSGVFYVTSIFKKKWEKGKFIPQGRKWEGKNKFTYFLLYVTLQRIYIFISLSIQTKKLICIFHFLPYPDKEIDLHFHFLHHLNKWFRNEWKILSPIFLFQTCYRINFGFTCRTS